MGDVKPLLLNICSCREGTTKPPAWTKKRVETMFPVEHPKVKTPEKVKPKEKPRPQNKPDPRLKQLEDLHSRNGVQASIHLPQGRRIKLDDGKSRPDSKLGRKPKANFDIEFSKLDAKAPTREEFVIREASDDELPDPMEMLKNRGAGKSRDRSDSTSYHDSEMDALIRDMPSPPATQARSTGKRKIDVEDGLIDLSSSPELPTPKRRRGDRVPTDLKVTVYETPGSLPGATIRRKVRPLRSHRNLRVT